MWIRLQKYPGNASLWQQYLQVKAEVWHCADKAREKWREHKAVEAESLYESAVRLG